jgi:hypothetical protein
MKKTVLSRLLLFAALICLVGGAPAPVRADAPLYVSPSGSGTACSPSAPCSADQAISQISGDALLLFESGTYTSNDPEWVLHFALTDPNATVKVLGSCSWDPGGASYTCGGSNPPSIIDGEDARVPVLVLGTDTTSFEMKFFSITNGDATGIETGFCHSYYGGTVNGCGGGMRVGTLGSLELESNSFYYNRASNDISAPLAVSIGGGLYVDGAAEVLLAYNDFQDNYASVYGTGIGGGVYIFGDDTTLATLEFNTFTNNESSVSSHDGSGAGLTVEAAKSVTLWRNTFTENNALFRMINGGAAYIHNTANLVWFYGNIFSGNDGADSVAVTHSSITNDVVFSYNHFKATGSLTACRIFGDFDLEMFNNMFAPFPPGRSPDRGVMTVNVMLIGAGVIVPKATANLRFNSFAYGSRGIYLRDNLDATVQDNIIAHTTGFGILTSGSSVTVDIANNLFHDNTGAGGMGQTGTLYHTGDPLFNDPAAADLHIQPGSAAVGLAPYDLTYIYDFDGQLRQAFAEDLYVDLGADELYGRVHLPFCLK